MVGLIVRSDDCRLGPTPLGNFINSTDIIASSKIIGYRVNWSNNITCFLPTGTNVTDSNNAGSIYVSTSPFIIALKDLEKTHALATLATIAFILSAWSAATSDIFISSRYLFFLAECGQVPFAWFFRRLKKFRGIWITFGRNEDQEGDGGGGGVRFERSDQPTIIPWACLIVSFGFGLLSLMASATGNAVEVFHWLSSMTSAAALLSWIGMSYTYLR